MNAAKFLAVSVDHLCQGSLVRQGDAAAAALGPSQAAAQPGLVALGALQMQDMAN